MKAIIAGTALAALALAAPASAQTEAQMMRASAIMKGPEGETLGTVSLAESENGVLIRADLSGLPPGLHAFHIHETGACEPDFGAAGDHYNPAGTEHGTLNPAGAHAGDLPNIWAAESGKAVHHVISRDVTLALTDVTLAGAEASTLFDEDGSALIIHENPDSYEAEAGAGGRIACGVIESAG